MYKIGQTVKIENKYDKPFDWPEEGTLEMLLNDDNSLAAKYEVKQVDNDFIYGQVTNTYGHKRRK